jgi:hypothetical protein
MFIYVVTLIALSSSFLINNPTKRRTIWTSIAIFATQAFFLTISAFSDAQNTLSSSYISTAVTMGLHFKLCACLLAMNYIVMKKEQLK